MIKDRISIIIPTYKRSHFLERAINSVLSQTYENIEIIVIDDNKSGSQERQKTELVMEKYRDEKKVIYIQNLENIGGALSRNKGIEVSSGKYITFLDDDDEYMSTKLEKQYYFYKNKFEKNEGFIYCHAMIVDNNLKEIPTKLKKINGNKMAFFEILKGGFTSTGCLFVAKKILLEVQGFKKLDCGQEWYLMLKIITKGYECYCLEEKLLKYHVHSEERISNNLKKLSGEKYLYEIKKEYIKGLPLSIQKELNYFNNITLCLLYLEFNDRNFFCYLKKALSYKFIRIEDIIKISTKIIFNQKSINQIRRIIKI